ncbi:MAG: DNA-binding protein [Deltaproteobacteria bacterium]|nr:DNA-binding protein [Deltaproteobacteria bacterium]
MEQERELQSVKAGTEGTPAQPALKLGAGGANPPRPPERSRKVRRYQRRSQLRAKTIALKRLTKEEIRIGREVFPPMPYCRPLSRAECEDGPRPCPYVSCKHHLYLDVNPETGSIKLNFPHLEPWEMVESCSLDVAERGGITLEEVGTIVNLTRERVRQVEVRATTKLRLLSSNGDLGPISLPRK